MESQYEIIAQIVKGESLSMQILRTASGVHQNRTLPLSAQERGIKKRQIVKSNSDCLPTAASEFQRLLRQCQAVSEPQIAATIVRIDTVYC